MGLDGLYIEIRTLLDQLGKVLSAHEVKLQRSEDGLFSGLKAHCLK